MRWPRLLTGPALLALGLATALAAGQDPQDPPAKGKRPPVAKKKAAQSPAARLSDEQTLKQAGLDPDDGPKLLAYLKQRTLTDVEQGKIEDIIRRFAADDFDERDRASAEVEKVGSSAVGPLKKAEKDPDPEVAYRARLALRRMEKVSHTASAAAAVRAVARLKPEGAAAALIGYLPLADSEAVADTIREALVALAVADGKADPALVAALTDASAARRAAAYVALTEGGDGDERIRVQDAYPKVRKAVLAEADPEAKFAGLWALAVVTREKEYVPELIRLVPAVGRGRLWQVEDLLLQLAGAHPPGGRFGRSADSVAKASDAWLGWWKEKGGKADLAGLVFAPRVRGFTDIIEMDNRSGTGQNRVVGLGPDMRERWRFTGLGFPTDVRVAPNGNVWVAEMNTNRVTEREPTGAVVTTRNVPNQPVNLDLLPDGGMLVTCKDRLVRFDKDGNQSLLMQRPNYDIQAGRPLPNGEAVFVTNYYVNPNQPAPPPRPGQGPPQNFFRLDGKGVEVKWADPKKQATIGNVYMMQAMGVVGEDRVLVCEQDLSNRGRVIDQVAEYEVKTGKQVWKYECPPNSGPSSAQRLANGNTLICLMNQNRLIEVDTSASPAGEIVWEYQAKDNLQVGRAYRR
jgi:outer membrane protein assembly factor BamB